VNSRLPLMAVAAILLLPVPRHAAAQSQDEAAVRALAMKQGDTWNRHDAEAYAALFTEDCDVVNVLGWWWKSRNEVETKLTGAFASMFRQSTLDIHEVSVRFLSPTIALAHVRWTMTGAMSPAGIPEPHEGIQTLTVSKVGGEWLIAGFQNTNSVPERAFPTSDRRP
jgi:uncharacterized protein (TIGR02246 family)